VPELFHIALPGDWDAARAAGSYEVSTRGRTLADVGFIHCSFAGQVSATASQFYRDLAEVVVLRIDPDRLTSPVIVEASFPHVYGPINLDAVVGADTIGPELV
jgi:uncharacterized protein (DUF952 family)